MILQSIASQIDHIWNEYRSAAGSETMHAQDHATILARDFVIVSVPQHELADHEWQTIGEHLRSVTAATASWEERGGVYVPAEKGTRWVGLQPEPHRK